MSTDALEISRLIKASVANVYQAWVKPELMCQWMGPGNVVCDKVLMDVKVGGKYELHMQTDDGIKIALGEYKAVEENKMLVFTWHWQDGNFRDSLVTLSFEAKGNDTFLVLKHENLPTAESAEHHTAGWAGSIDKLERYLA